MKPSLRQVLADSNVAAVAIAWLLLGTVVWICQFLWSPISNFLPHLITAFKFSDASELRWFSAYFGLQVTILVGLLAIWYLLAAWILSRWVYGTGPLAALRTCHHRLTGRKNA